MLPTKFRFIWPSGFSGEDFLEIEKIFVFLTYQDEMRLPSFHSFGHVLSEGNIF